MVRKIEEEEEEEREKEEGEEVRERLCGRMKNTLGCSRALSYLPILRW